MDRFQSVSCVFIADVAYFKIQNWLKLILRLCYENCFLSEIRNFKCVIFSFNFEIDLSIEWKKFQN